MKKFNLIIFVIASIVAIVNISAFIDLLYTMKTQFIISMAIFTILVLFDKDLIGEFV